MLNKEADFVVVRHASIIEASCDYKEGGRYSFLEQYRGNNVVDLSESIVECQQNGVTRKLAGKPQTLQ